MEMIGDELILTELGVPAVITAQQWDIQGFEDVVPKLESERILATRWLGEFCSIQAGTYVGNARSAKLAVTIKPRFPDFFQVIKKFLTDAASRNVRFPNPAFHDESRKSPLSPVQRFLISLNNCLDEGIPFHYVPVTTSTEFPRGVLDVNATVKNLLSTGMSHRVICRESKRLPLFDFCSVVNAAGILAKQWLSDERALTQLTWLETALSVFSPNREMNLDEAVKLAESILDGTLSDSATDLIASSLALLKMEGVLQPIQHRSRKLSFDFLKTDYLWELAVFQIFAEISIFDVRFHPMRASKTTLLIDGGPQIDPDVTLNTGGGDVVAVLDAKYSVATSAAASDLYQILAYSDRLEAQHGVLIYITNDKTWIRKIGTTRRGGVLWEVGIQKDNPISELRSASQDLSRLLITEAHSVRGVQAESRLTR